MRGAGLSVEQADLAHRVSALELAARRLAAGVLSGLHRSTHRGGSAEFAEYAEYVPGDDPRTIDWKCLARTDRWYVRRFEETTNRPAWLVLDASASMGFARGERPRKIDLARLLLVALGALLLRQGDAVGAALARAGSLAATVPARARGDHLLAILRLLAAGEAGGKTELASALDAIGAVAARRSLVIVASDLVDETDAVGSALRRLAARGHELLVLQVLDRDEIGFPYLGVLRFRDEETGESVLTDAAAVAASYREELARFLGACERECAGAAADLVRLDNSEDAGQALLRFLARRAALARRLGAAGRR